MKISWKILKTRKNILFEIQVNSAVDRKKNKQLKHFHEPMWQKLLFITKTGECRVFLERKFFGEKKVYRAWKRKMKSWKLFKTIFMHKINVFMSSVDLEFIAHPRPKTTTFPKAFFLAFECNAVLHNNLQYAFSPFLSPFPSLFFLCFTVQ